MVGSRPAATDRRGGWTTATHDRGRQAPGRGQLAAWRYRVKRTVGRGRRWIRAGGRTARFTIRDARDRLFDKPRAGCQRTLHDHPEGGKRLVGAPLHVLTRRGQCVRFRGQCVQFLAECVHVGGVCVQSSETRGFLSSGVRGVGEMPRCAWMTEECGGLGAGVNGVWCGRLSMNGGADQRLDPG